MSHSQFHKYKLLILRHAWLSPSDKHMTTGRINQVSILLVFSRSLRYKIQPMLHCKCCNPRKETTVVVSQMLRIPQLACASQLMPHSTRLSRCPLGFASEFALLIRLQIRIAFKN